MESYVTPKEMKKVWQIELDLLQKLLDVCQRHGLRCWVDGGTLLGAVRHRGFIPWDDDIDVCMMRDDYDRLLAIGEKEFTHPYFLQSAYSDVDYFLGHAQLRNSQTAAIRPSASYNPFNQGIFIDIFVLDGVPQSEQERQRVHQQVRRTLRFLKAKNTNILASGRWGLLFRKLRCRHAVKKKGWQAIYRQAEDLLRATPISASKEIAEISFSGYQVVLDKHIYDETVWLDFEGMKVPAPSGYQELLRTQYGDNYMTPIQQPTLHGELIFDTERSYKELIWQVRKAYRRSMWRRMMKKVGWG